MCHAFTYVILCFVYDAGLHHFYLRRDHGKIDTAALLRLSYQTETIKLVNEQLQRPERRPSDALLVSVLILAIHGANDEATHEHSHPQSPLATAQNLDFYGSMKLVAAHMQALQVLVKWRRGLDAIDLYRLADTIVL